MRTSLVCTFALAALLLTATTQADTSPTPAAAPFTGSETVSADTVAAGATATITASFTDSGAAVSNANADIEVYGPNGKQAGQKIFPQQNWSAGGTNKYTYDFTAPHMAGNYAVTIVVTSANWATQYFALYQPAKFTVTDTVKSGPKPTFTGSGSASHASVAAGKPVTISASFTSTGGALSNANVDMEVYGADGKRCGQKVFPGERWTAGATNKYTYDWTAPSTPGAYAVTLVITSADWSTQYFALYPAAKVTVTAP